MLLSRQAEIGLIDTFIAEHGVTLCESRFAYRSNALTGYELAARLVAFTPRPRPRRSTREENQRRWRELLHLAATAPDIDRAYQLWLTRMPVRLGR